MTDSRPARTPVEKRDGMTEAWSMLVRPVARTLALFVLWLFGGVTVALSQTPDFTGISPADRQAMEQTCRGALLASGPAANLRCLSNQIEQIRSVTAAPDFAGISAGRPASDGTNLPGHSCLRADRRPTCAASQIRSSKSGASRQLRTSLAFRRPTGKRWNKPAGAQLLASGPAANLRCLSNQIEQIRSVTAAPDFAGISAADRASDGTNLPGHSCLRADRRPTCAASQIRSSKSGASRQLRTSLAFRRPTGKRWNKPAGAHCLRADRRPTCAASQIRSSKSGASRQLRTSLAFRRPTGKRWNKPAGVHCLRADRRPTCAASQIRSSKSGS